MFFRPEIVDPNWERPLDQELDETILLCPVDLRRDLYKVRPPTLNSNHRTSSFLEEVAKPRDSRIDSREN